MPDSPLISVIVPVYNVEKYLRKCLESIFGQTYRNLEILCVNDGSTDTSPAISGGIGCPGCPIQGIHPDQREIKIQ